MPRWLPAILRRIDELARAGRVSFTLKAARELALLGLDADDACDVLASLNGSDFEERLASALTGEWLYVFKPVVGGTRLYVKVALRNGCLVVSFHEDEVSDAIEDDT